MWAVREKASARSGYRRVQTKLNVLTQAERQSLWTRQLVIAALLLVGAVAEVIIVQLFYSETVEQQLVDEVLNIRVYRLTPYMLYVYSILVVVVFVFALAMFLTYTQRILLHSHAKMRSHEQMWGMLRNGALLLYINPIPYVVFITKYLATAGNVIDPPSNGLKQMIALGKVFKSSMFIAGTYLYFWTCVHSFRVPKGPLPRLFYIPKIGLLIVYILLGQVLFWRYGVTVSELPLLSFLYLVRICVPHSSLWRREVVLAVVSYALLELFIVLWIARDVLLTHWDVAEEQQVFISNAESAENGNGGSYSGTADECSIRVRSWRFFSKHHALVYPAYYIAYSIILFGTPAGASISAAKMWSLYLLALPRTPVLLLAYWLGYAVVESFVNLPPDSSGLKGWFVPTTITA